MRQKLGGTPRWERISRSIEYIVYPSGNVRNANGTEAGNAACSVAEDALDYFARPEKVR